MTIGRRQFVFGAAAGLAACGRRRGPGFDGFAFVANEEGRAIAVVNLSVLALVRHIALDAPPSQILSHPGKPLIYALTPSTGTVHEIAIDKMAVTRKTRIAGSAISMRLADDRAALWVLSAESRKLFRLPLDGLRPDWSLGLREHASDFDLSQWTNLAVVAYGTEGSVQVFDLSAGKGGTPLRVAEEVGVTRFRSDGRALLVANRSGRMLTVVRAPETRLMTHLPLPLRPDNFCFHPDGGQLFITGEGMDAVVTVFPHFVPQVAETALAGHAPAAMTASDRFLFITSPTTGDLIVMNIDTRKVIAVATVGSEPGFVALTPNNEYALVLNRRSGDMAVIRTRAIAPNRQKSVALLTMIPVGSRPVSAVVRSV